MATAFLSMAILQMMRLLRSVHLRDVFSYGGTQISQLPPVESDSTGENLNSGLFNSKTYRNRFPRLDGVSFASAGGVCTNDPLVGTASEGSLFTLKYTRETIFEQKQLGVSLPGEQSLR